MTEIFLGAPICLVDENGVKYGVKQTENRPEVLAEPSSQVSAFGELLTAKLTPRVQIDFNYNLNADIIDTTLTGSGTATQSNSKMVLQTTAADTSSAQLTSRRVLKYNPGQGALVRFTSIFTTGVANSSQEIGGGDATDGLFFGYNGVAFGILRRQNSVDYWTVQSNWNLDQGGGMQILPFMDWTKGNVFQVRYQWLGFGAITFSVENPSTGRFIEVHRIQYANAYTDPSIFNPSLPLCARVENTSNATNIMLQSSSMAGFIEGDVEDLGPINAISNTKSGVTTTLTNILTIRNKTTFASKANKVSLKLKFLSYSVDGTKPAIVQMVRNATLGGSPSYNDISANTSVVDYDIAGTTVTGGKEIIAFSPSKAGGDTVPMQDLNIELLPGETLTVAVAATSGTTDATVATTWREDF